MESLLAKYKGMKVLVVDDEEEMCRLLTRVFEQNGLISIMAHDGDAALDKFSKNDPDIVVLDVLMPGLGGRETMLQMRLRNPDIPVIFMTGLAGVPGAVDAMKLGAFDYIAKPFEIPEMLDVVGRALEERLSRKRYTILTRKRRQQQDEILGVMGTSDVITQLAASIRRIAGTQFDVLLCGERGVGKSVVAQIIHSESSRARQPFVAIACDAQSEEQLERELFGFVANAFPEAGRGQVGLLEKANKGSVYIEEISAMPLSIQEKFLRTLQDRAVLRIGSEQASSLDVRVICSSSIDISEMIEEKTFRRDLYYCLKEYSVHIPALRERKTDIPYLAMRFLKQANKELSKKIQGFSPRAMEKLMSFHWPANVTQLHNVVRRAVFFAENMVSDEQLDLEMAIEKNHNVLFLPEMEELRFDEEISLKEHIRKYTSQIERQILLEMLKHTGWNKAKAARFLQIDYKTMQTKVKEYRLQDPDKE